MHALLSLIAESVAQVCEFASVIVVALGAFEAIARSIWRWRDYGDPRTKRAIWLRFAGAILLGLEFALAADITRTAIEPSWTELGQLAAIAAIRTVLSIFLERDLTTAEANGTHVAAPPPGDRPVVH
jgi:uncharacterized membrane protein